jgi:PST family polysaccharide transporter
MSLGFIAAPRAAAKAHGSARLPSQTLRLVAANAARIAIQLALIPILARIIAPQAFGLVALATPVVIFTAIAAEAGLVTGLVRSRVSPAAESTAFWFSAAIGLACALLVALAAWPFGQLARQPGLAPILLALSPALFLTCLTIAPNARLQRTGAFTAFAVGETLSSIAGAGMALWAAKHGWGAWSLVSQQLVLTGVRFAANMGLSGFRPQLTFRFAELKPVLALATPLLGANLLAYLSRSLDNLLIGLWIGPQALGFYATAYQVVQIPEFAFGASVRTAAMPAIAHAQDRNQAMGIYLKGLRTVSLLATPLVIGCSLKAEALVRLVLGPAWLPAAPLIAILAPLGLIHAYFQLNTAALIGLGAARTQLKLSVLTSVLGLAGIAAGFHWGAKGVATGYALAMLIATGPNFYCVLRAMDAPWRRLISGLGRAWIASAVMTVTLILRAQFSTQRPALWDLPESALVGAAAYVIAFLYLELVRPAYLAPRPRIRAWPAPATF